MTKIVPIPYKSYNDTVYRWIWDEFNRIMLDLSLRNFFAKAKKENDGR